MRRLCGGGGGGRWVWWWWCGPDVTAMSLSIPLHAYAPNSDGRTLGSQTLGVPATWASTSG